MGDKWEYFFKKSMKRNKKYKSYKIEKPLNIKVIQDIKNTQF